MEEVIIAVMELAKNTDIGMTGDCLNGYRFVGKNDALVSQYDNLVKLIAEKFGENFQEMELDFEACMIKSGIKVN